MKQQHHSGTWRALGMMSGTSMDGVDAAILETDGERILGFGRSRFRPYTASDQQILRDAIQAARGLDDRHARPPLLAEAERIVTEAHIESVHGLLADTDLAPGAIDIIGFHGQTVLHRPAAALTIQIGDGAALAQATGIDVVWDFRADDVAAGGEGAPLVPAFHRALVDMAGIEAPVALVNIGGVANATWIGPDGGLIAFDTGPGNALIDDLVRARCGLAMDAEGRLAARGRIDEDMLRALLSDAFFELAPPKSLDRHAFSPERLQSLGVEDAAATLTAFTAETIAHAARHMPSAPRRWIIAGGGARNPAMMAQIAARTGAAVEPAATYGWSEDFIEAQAFAFLAVRSLRGLPLTFPGTTGISRPLSGGRTTRVRRAA